jgi:hypothetical protein
MAFPPREIFMEDRVSYRVLFRLLVAVCSAAALILIPAATSLAGDPNAGDVWVDNVGQPAGPGHENDPHLACQDINLWGSGLADSSGDYTVDGWSPSGTGKQAYGPANWSYNQSTGSAQVLDVISVKTLIDNAIANGDVPQANQGFHFKLEFSADPQKHKTFWVNCSAPSITTNAASASIGQAIHDQATLSGGNSPTGSITWNVYSSSDTSCSKVLDTVSAPVHGDGTYESPDFTPSTAGSYQWVATYSGDAQNVSESTRCNDPNEQSTVTKATPAIATHATSATPGQPIHDVATLTGGDNPTGTITWNVYAAGACTTSLDTVSEPVTGDGTYTSPDITPAAGSYQWVATYSGDANNVSVATLCNDPNEQSSVQQTPAPGISLIKLERDGSSGSFTHGPVTGNIGDTIDYQMTVVNTGNTSLVITFTDPHCDAGTLSVPTVLSGTFDPATSTLSSGGELQYTCSHVLVSGDAPQFSNTASVSGQPPSGPPVTATDTVVALLNTPGMTVTKLQRDGSTGAFTTGTITAMVGDTIEYEIQVTNTGNTTLALSLSDPHCDAGTIHGPTAVSGTLNGNVLSPGGEAQYTCSHVLVAGDAPTFTNVGTITGQPPSGPPLSGSGVVVANVTTAGIQVVKLQRDGSSGSFTTAPINAKVGDTIEYEIQVTNTGTAPLTLTPSDPLCDAGTISGPTPITGTLNGNVLSPGGEAQYTCSHVLTANDASPFTNTATVTGQPPSGPPVIGTSSVTANKQAVSPVTIKAVKPVKCPRGKVKRTKKVHGKKRIVCVAKKRSIISRAPIHPSGFTG